MDELTHRHRPITQARPLLLSDCLGVCPGSRSVSWAVHLPAEPSTTIELVTGQICRSLTGLKRRQRSRELGADLLLGHLVIDELLR